MTGAKKNCPFQRLQKHHETSEIVLCQTFDIFRGDSSRLSRLSWWLFALSRSWVIRLTRWCSNSISNKEDTASAGTNECHRSMASATNDQNIQTSWLTDGVFNGKSLCSLCADRVPIVLHSALAIWIQVNLPLTMLCDRLVGDVICLYTILYLSPPISSFEILLNTLSWEAASIPVLDKVCVKVVLLYNYYCSQLKTVT